MKEIDKLKKEYIEKFDDYFPNHTISDEYELVILKDCLEKNKDAYDLGYFDLEYIY